MDPNPDLAFFAFNLPRKYCIFQVFINPTRFMSTLSISNCHLKAFNGSPIVSLSILPTGICVFLLFNKRRMDSASQVLIKKAFYNQKRRPRVLDIRDPEPALFREKLLVAKKRSRLKRHCTLIRYIGRSSSL